MLFSDECEMSYGDQAALLGLLHQLRPKLAMEIGTYRGGSLNLIAEIASEVHSFDLAPAVERDWPNVTFHVGNTRTTVPAFLRELEKQRKVVDFVLVDGDHARAGVASDLRSLLDSPAISRAVILLHDAANEDVRAGIRDADIRREKVTFADLSFTVPLNRRGVLLEKWGGFALIVVDADGHWWPHRRGVASNASWSTSTPASVTWRFAAPLRQAKRRISYGLLRPLVRRYRGSRHRPLSAAPQVVVPERRRNPE